MTNLKLTWVLAHQPYEVFHKAAQHMAQEVAAETNGRITIEVMDLPDYNKIAGLNLTTKGSDRDTIIEMVNRGAIDMATVYINSLGKINKDLYVWGMPFLFQEVNEATATLDGEIGQALLNKVAENSNVKPLAYTFSGGFRLMPAIKPLEDINSMLDLKVRCVDIGPVGVDTFKAVGATPVQLNVEDVREAMATGLIEAGETSYPRFFILGHDKSCKVINHTQHNLLLTSVVTNNFIWNSFDEKTKMIFARAALNAARIERQESINSIQSVQRKAASLGIPTVTMTAKEKQKFVDMTKTIYSKYNNYFSPGLLSNLTRK